LKVIILNTGSVHPIHRTIAISGNIDILEFIELGGKLADHDLLAEIGIHTTFLKPSIFPLVKYLKQKKADAYICHFASGVHVKACILAKKHPLIIIAMGGDILHNEMDRHRTIFDQYLIRETVRKADLIFAKSNYIAVKLKKWKINKYIINYWGTYPLEVTTAEKQDARNRLGIPKSKKIILSPRVFEYRCNIDLISEAFHEIISNIDSNVCIVFFGFSENNSYALEIKENFKRWNISDSAIFLPVISNSEIIEYFKASDIAISLAKSDGFPNSVLELLYCRTLVIAGRIPQTEELLSHMDNALLCDLTSEDLVKKLTWAIDPANSNKIPSITQNGLSTVEIFGDIRKNADLFLNSIKNISFSKKSFPLKILLLIFLEIIIGRFIRIFKV
jgi:glycosyltransferase involved in cell wall biosynthesis